MCDSSVWLVDILKIIMMTILDDETDCHKIRLSDPETLDVLSRLSSLKNEVKNEAFV